LDKKFKPKDFTAEIECKNALTFQHADEYYTEVVNICTCFENQLSDTTKLKYLAKKCQSSTYVKLVSDQLEATLQDSKRHATRSPKFSVLSNPVANKWSASQLARRSLSIAPR
jgi:hypothetical protein